MNLEEAIKATELSEEKVYCEIDPETRNLEEAIKATELSEEKVYCEINPETREISVPETYKIIGVESDEDVERVWFKCPKVVGDNIDLSKYQLRVNYQNANSDKGQYIITDVKIDGDNIIFSWLLGRLVTAYVGQISFIICAVNVSSSDIKNEWNTTLAQAQVLTGLEVEPQDLPTTGDDLINQLKSLTAQTQTFARTAQAASESAQSNAQSAQQSAQTATQASATAAESADTAEQAMTEANETAKSNIAAIQQASEQAQEDIASAKTTSVNAVETAKEEATSEITTSKTSALESIETAKDEAIEEIKESGLFVLDDNGYVCQEVEE